MKKITTFLLSSLLVCISCIGLVGCKKDPGKIRLTETTHSVFYAPLYAAINLGFMEEEGISIELTNSGGSDAGMASLLSGNADIALLGPEPVVYAVAGGSTSSPVVFGQLTKKDGTFLVSKTPINNFNWATSLVNKKVIAGRAGGVPAMTFEWVVNQVNLFNNTNITLDTSTAFNMMVPVFDSPENDADFCTMFEPTASEYVSLGKGHIIASVGEQSGDIPYTCFIAKPSFLNKNKDLAKGFLRAVKKGYDYLMTHTDAEGAEAIYPSFKTTSKTLLASSIASYKSIDAWMATPAMSVSSYNRLLDVLINAGTIDSRIAFDKVVDNTLAYSFDE